MTALKWWWKLDTLMPSSLRDVVDPQRLVELFTEALDGSGNVVGVTALDRDVTEPVSLLTHQEPVDDFPCDQRREERRFGGGIQEPDEPHDSVQQAGVQRADVNGPHIGMLRGER